MCVSFPSILQKHSNWSELRNHISVRFSEMGGKHHVQEIPVRKATCAGRWPAGEKLQHRDRKMQLPLPPIYPAFRLPQGWVWQPWACIHLPCPCRESRDSSHTNPCVGSQALALAFPRALGCSYIPLPHLWAGSCRLSPKPRDPMGCPREKSLGEVAHASFEAAPRVCGGAASASVSVLLTAHKTKLHI